MKGHRNGAMDDNGDNMTTAELYTAAATNNRLIYAGDEGCTLAEAMADLAGANERPFVRAHSEGDFEIVTNGSATVALYFDGHAWSGIELP